MFKCEKRYINIDIVENAIPNIDTLKHKCSINELIISLIWMNVVSLPSIINMYITV